MVGGTEAEGWGSGSRVEVQGLGFRVSQPGCSRPAKSTQCLRGGVGPHGQDVVGGAEAEGRPKKRGSEEEEEHPEQKEVAHCIPL